MKIVTKNGNINFGDCFELMKSIPDKSIDMVFTSPPYKEEDISEDYWLFYEKMMNEFKRITKKIIIILHSATKLNNFINKFPPKRTMIWGKGISQYSWRWNPIYCYQISDEYKINKYIWCDVFGVESVTGKWKVHKYQDPELLYETIIKMFKECDSLLDPFIGSGTTALVCEKLYKQYIGFEKNNEYYNILYERLKEYIV